MADAVEIPNEFVPRWIRVTDPVVDEVGQKRTKDNPGGFISYTGIAHADVTDASVGQTFKLFDQDVTISNVWREGRAGEEVVVSFKEYPLEAGK